jgi:hypothetical protein
LKGGAGMNELKPCPFCGGEVEVKDFTSNKYGFQDYEIRCKCGMRFRYGSTCEHYWVGKTYHTPQTERAKKIAYDNMVADYNRRITP